MLAPEEQITTIHHNIIDDLSEQLDEKIVTEGPISSSDPISHLAIWLNPVQDVNTETLP